MRGYRTHVRLCVADKLAVIALTAADDGAPMAIVERAFEWVGPALARALGAPVRTAPDPAWRRYVGRYRSPWRDVHVLLMDDGLLVVDPTLPDPMLAPTRLVPAGPHAFRVEDADGYGLHGELVRFELDAEGRLRRLRMGENYLDPVESW